MIDDLFVPDPPSGDSSNRIATTRFVAGALSAYARSGANSDITSLSVLASINGGQVAGFRNLLINADGRINQRAPTSNANNTYGHDRWYALTQTSTVAVSTVADAENGTPSMWRLTQSQATAQRMGYAQVIKGANCKYLRGKSVTLSGRINFSLNAAVRYAILEWTGTEDTVTRDVVNSWTSGTYTTGNFFKSTTTNVLVVGAITPAAATLTDLTALTATVGSSANNLIVFVWTEGTAAQNATLDAAPQIEQGGVATAREFMPIALLKQSCGVFYEKSYGDGVVPGASTFSGMAAITAPTAATNFAIYIPYKYSKNAAPTMRRWDAAGNANRVSATDSAFARTDNINSGSTSLTGITTEGFLFRDAGGAGNLGASAIIGYSHWDADAEL